MEPSNRLDGSSPSLRLSPPEDSGSPASRRWLICWPASSTDTTACIITHSAIRSFRCPFHPSPFSGATWNVSPSCRALNSSGEVSSWSSLTVKPAFSNAARVSSRAGVRST